MTEEQVKDPDGILPKVAHIVNQPGHEVGDKVMTLCGEKQRVHILWGDLPHDHPICRDCVDMALLCLTEATDQNSNTVRALVRVFDSLNRAVDTATDSNTLTEVVDRTHAYADKQQAKKQRKADLAKARRLIEEADGKKKDKKTDNKKENQHDD